MTLEFHLLVEMPTSRTVFLPFVHIFSCSTSVTSSAPITGLLHALPYCFDHLHFREKVEKHYHGEGIQNILWTDCKNRKTKALSDLQAMILESLKNEIRFNRTNRTEFLVMVVGIPNVGKSSLINSLRTINLGKEQKAVAEGAYNLPV